MPIDDEEPTEYGCGSCSYTTTNEDDLMFVDDTLLCEDCRAWCNNCEEYTWNDNTHYVEGIGDYCETCWENHTNYCERCSNTYSDSESMYHIEDRGEYWCEGCYEHEGSYCEAKYAVPTHWAEAHQLISYVTDYYVWLFSYGFCHCL